MNMISTGSFLTEMDASSKQETLAEKFAAVWEKKNAKAARVGGVSLMALSLAACGSSDDTAVVDEPVVEEPVVEEPVVTTPVAQSFTLTTSNDVIEGGAGDDTINFIDTAVFSDLRNNYTITRDPNNPNVVTVKHSGGTLANGTDSRLRGAKVVW